LSLPRKLVRTVIHDHSRAFAITAPVATASVVRTTLSVLATRSHAPGSDRTAEWTVNLRRLTSFARTSSD